jgi:hypothetical protein
MSIAFAIFMSCPIRQRLLEKSNTIITLVVIPLYTDHMPDTPCQLLRKNGRAHG